MKKYLLLMFLLQQQQFFPSFFISLDNYYIKYPFSWIYQVKCKNFGIGRGIIKMKSKTQYVRNNVFKRLQNNPTLFEHQILIPIEIFDILIVKLQKWKSKLTKHSKIM